MGGLARLEYRGYDSAGHRHRHRRQRTARRRQARGQARQPLQGTRGDTRSTTAPPPSATPAGPPTERPPTRTRTPPRRRRPHRDHPQRHHRELRHPARRTRRRGMSSSNRRRTPRSPVTCSAREVDCGKSLTEAMRTIVRRLDGAFTLLAVDAREPQVVVGARRNSPLVIGLGEGENFLASDVDRVHRVHPRGPGTRPRRGCRNNARRGGGDRRRRRRRLPRVRIT